ncbi:hypothetical protein PG996_002376 [Apiospora saccharicola]|uniref:Uncharacterized protein n=1 Tax=Apiospora saccharicola TaxID=335842 RepID=A0ABR1WJB2_9PEZI
MARNYGELYNAKMKMGTILCDDAPAVILDVKDEMVSVIHEMVACAQQNSPSIAFMDKADPKDDYVAIGSLSKSVATIGEFFDYALGMINNQGHDNFLHGQIRQTRCPRYPPELGRREGLAGAFAWPEVPATCRTYPQRCRAVRWPDMDQLPQESNISKWDMLPQEPSFSKCIKISVHLVGESGQTYLILFSIIPGCLGGDAKRTLLKTTNKEKHTEKQYRRKFRKLVGIIRAPKRVFKRVASRYILELTSRSSFAIKVGSFPSEVCIKRKDVPAIPNSLNRYDPAESKFAVFMVSIGACICATGFRRDKK